MIVLKCPKCNAETKLSLVMDSYRGPRRCWKCGAMFTIEIENNRLVSCEPMSQEDFDRELEIKKLKDKFRRGPEE
jgi:hypothetical protein